MAEEIGEMPPRSIVQGRLCNLQYDGEFQVIEALEARVGALEEMLLECVKEGKIGVHMASRILRLLKMGVVK